MKLFNCFFLLFTRSNSFTLNFSNVNTRCITGLNHYKYGFIQDKPKLLYHYSTLYGKKERQPGILHYPYTPKNKNQETYLNYLHNNTVSIVVSVGPAGTGKTMFACIKAIELLKIGQIKKIIITRPIVAVEEEELGFLPGNLVKKMDPWTRPIMDIFMEHYSKTEIDNMIYTNTIEISPLAYMRGRTFKNAIIIADEMQNSSPNQMLMLATRIGLNSKLVITGDLKQTDRTIENNGLYDFINKVKIYKKYNNDNNTNNIEIIEFEKEDIERSKIVQNVINIYNYNYKESNNIKKKEELSDAALIPLNRLPKTF